MDFLSPPLISPSLESDVLGEGYSSPLRSYLVGTPIELSIKTEASKTMKVNILLSFKPSPITASIPSESNKTTLHSLPRYSCSYPENIEELKFSFKLFHCFASDATAR